MSCIGHHHMADLYLKRLDLVTSASDKDGVGSHEVAVTLKSLVLCIKDWPTLRRALRRFPFNNWT